MSFAGGQMSFAGGQVSFAGHHVSFAGGQVSFSIKLKIFGGFQVFSDEIYENLPYYVDEWLNQALPHLDRPIIYVNPDSKRIYYHSPTKDYFQLFCDAAPDHVREILDTSGQIIQNTPSIECICILAPALVDVLKISDSYFVQTCVTAALVLTISISKSNK